MHITFYILKCVCELTTVFPGHRLFVCVENVITQENGTFLFYSMSGSMTTTTEQFIKSYCTREEFTSGTSNFVILSNVSFCAVEDKN